MRAVRGVNAQAPRQAGDRAVQFLVDEVRQPPDCLTDRQRHPGNIQIAVRMPAELQPSPEPGVQCQQRSCPGVVEHDHPHGVVGEPAAEVRGGGWYAAPVLGVASTAAGLVMGYALSWILILNLALFGWRVLMKGFLVGRLYGPVQGLLCLPRMALTSLSRTDVRK